MATDDVTAVRLVDEVWEPILDGVIQTDRDVVVVAEGSPTGGSDSGLLAYDRTWWTGSEVVEAGWSYEHGECAGVGQVAVSAMDPATSAARIEPWPLPPPCLERLVTVWADPELLAFVWAGQPTCGEVGVAESDCTVLAAWHPLQGWEVRGSTPSVASAVWTGADVLAAADDGQLMRIAPDGAAEVFAATAPFGPLHWVGDAVVGWAAGAEEGTLVGSDGSAAALTLPPSAAVLTAVTTSDALYLATLDGEGLRICNRSTAAVTDPIRCPTTSLIIDGIDITEIPHTVSDGLGGRFTRDPVLVHGTVQDGVLDATGIPPRISIEPEAAMVPPSAGTVSYVATRADDGDHPMVGQSTVVELHVERSGGTVAVAIGSYQTVAGDTGGRAALWAAPPCPDRPPDDDGDLVVTEADEIDCSTPVIRLDTSAVEPGASYHFDLALADGIGTVQLTIHTARADDLPPPWETD